MTKYENIGKTARRLDALMNALDGAFFDVEAGLELLEKTEMARTLLHISIDLVRELREEIGELEDAELEEMEFDDMEGNLEYK